MLVAKIRKPFLTLISPIPDYGGVWRFRVAVTNYVQPTIFDATFFDFSGVNQEDTEIGNIFVDGIEYSEAISLAACRETTSTWFYNDTENILHIHAEHGKRLDSADINAQETLGYSSSRVFVDSNNKSYKPLIKGDIVINESADRLVWNKLTFNENELVLNNMGGEFDDYYDSPIQGSNIEYSHISYSDLIKGLKSLTPVYVGYVSGDNPGRKEFNLTVKDKRAQFSQLFPVNVFDSDTYPNASEDVIGEVIRDGWGDITGAKAFCTNDTVISGNVNYRVAESFTTLTTVYVYDEDTETWGEVTPSTSDSDTGSFTLSSVDGRDTDGVAFECKCDVTLRNVANAPRAVIDLVSEVCGCDYTSDYWDTTQIESEIGSYFSSSAGRISLLAEEQQEAYEYIQTLQGADVKGFRFSTNFDGKYSMKVDDIDREISRAYEAIENIDNELFSERDLTDYATSVKVIYGHDYGEDTSSYIVDDSREVSVFNAYRVYQQKEFDSILISESDAEDKADYIARDYSLARAELSFTIRGVTPKEIYDVISFDTAIVRKGVRIREYAGVRKLKISGVSYNFSRSTTTITGIDITEEVV